jgi:U3 small nucleolar RNA-associated protein 22
VLLVHLASPALTLRVMPVPPAGAFPLHKLAPDRNNVRWVARGGPAAGGAAQQPAQQQQQRQGEEGGRPHAGPSGQPSEWLATPAYNAAIAEDATAVAASAALAARLQASAPLRDALLLLKVWAVGAGLAAASGGAWPDDARPAASAIGMSGHLLAAVLLCAAEAAGPPAAAMSSFQLLRAALGLLADAAAWSTGLAAGRAHGKGGQQQKQQQQQNGASEGQGPPLPAVFRKAYPVVLLDATGWTNLAAGVPQSLLAQAQLLARRTLAVLDHPADAEAAFAAAFLARLRPAALFDYLWAVTLPEPEGGALPPRGDVSQARYADVWGGGVGLGWPAKEASRYGGGRWFRGATAEPNWAPLIRVPGQPCRVRRQDEALVEGLVRKALTSRARLVRALPRTPAFPTAAAGGVLGALAAGASVPASSPLLVGAVVDAAEALRAVDVGPPANDTAAAARFRALWGERSELRRFQDGRICEAVVWDAPGDARHTVPDAAVSTLLRRHLPEGSRVSCSASRLDGALDAAAPAGGAIAPLGAVAAGRAAESALDKLARQLRGLGEVVLKVVGVQPLSPVSRRTAAFVPEPHPLVGGPGGLAAAAGAANLPRCLDPLEVMVSLEGSGGEWNPRP